MAKVDWYSIRFLESSTNLKHVIKESVGRVPSTKIANEIAVCVRQGRLFFEAAQSAPIEIQPLLAFYGIVGFAKAIVISRKLIAIDSLKQSHGIRDMSSQNAKVEQLRLKFGQDGTFQQFNDTLAELGGINHLISSMPKWIPKPFDMAQRLADEEMSIKEIFSRVPRLEDLYEKTFHEPAKSLSILLHIEHEGYASIRIDDPELFSDRETLIRIVQELRNQYPFLNDWCLCEASLAWNNSVLIFCNIDKTGLVEFSPDFLHETKQGFTAPNAQQYNCVFKKISVAEILPPLTGGIANNSPSAIQPYKGTNLSEYSLYFLGCFLLSTLVRYRPQIWQHAVTRSVVGLEADDRSLALIERFLDIVLVDFPSMVVDSIEFARRG